MSDNSRVRVSIVGVVIVALFASLLARLWFLQVGPDRTQDKLSLLTERTIQTASPRGEIVDRNGVVLVQDRLSWAVSVDRDLGPKTRVRVLGQLSELLGRPYKDLLTAYQSKAQSPLLPAVVAHDITVDQQIAIEERATDFPGVHVIGLTVRSYPAADKFHDAGLAAQVLGYIGSIPADQLNRYEKKGYQPGDTVGLDGVEAAYESVLHGRPERITVNVDPRGLQVGAPVKVVPGSVGQTVRLTLDARVQVAAERALDNGIQAARKMPVSATEPLPLKATEGAVVVLDAQDGSVVAMANYPSYPLKWWVGGISETDYSFLNSPLANAPLLNRASSGLFAPGSSFKLVTALAMTKYNMRGAYFPFPDTGSVTIGNRVFKDDDGTAHGNFDLQRAITVSSDVYFYTIGNSFWQAWNLTKQAIPGLGLQAEARELGFGAPTGFDLSESPGRIPDPTWKQQFSNLINKDPAAKLANGQWYPGDEVNLAVGQGDVAVTPLQLANAYACFANDGTLLTPHVGMGIENPVTKASKAITPPPRGHVQFDDQVTRPLMEQGFKGVVSDPSGTAYNAFLGVNVPVAGKTGTAQVNGKAPTSVFAAYFPADSPKYVVVAMVAQGGHGAQTAAPIVRQVIQAIENPGAVAG